MKPILELKNINKIYGTDIKTQVLYDINLSFEEGSFNSIIGQSGSGKSMIADLIQLILVGSSEFKSATDGNNWIQRRIRENFRTHTPIEETYRSLSHANYLP